MARSITTRFLVLSDTHGDVIDLPTAPVDVVIHCGDLTEESKLSEFQKTIEMLQQVNAPLKLVIPGNHDFTLDPPMFATKLLEAGLSPSDETVKTSYGESNTARDLFTDVERGITLLDEGTHHFLLPNGAALIVYASPYTPSTNDWGFQYDPTEDHTWDIPKNVNIAITHGPPRGIFDQTDGNVRAGSASLFRAIAGSRPQMHCFGHMHAGWGARRVRWREGCCGETTEGEVSHFTAIDNEESRVVESLGTLRERRFDTEEVKVEKAVRLDGYTQQRCCTVLEDVQVGKETLFVNAAIEGCEESYPKHLPWIVEIALPEGGDVDGSTVAR